MHWGYESPFAFGVWLTIAVLAVGGSIWMPFGVSAWMACLGCYSDFGNSATPLSAMTVNTSTANISQVKPTHA